MHLDACMTAIGDSAASPSPSHAAWTTMQTCQPAAFEHHKTDTNSPLLHFGPGCRDVFITRIGKISRGNVNFNVSGAIILDVWKIVYKTFGSTGCHGVDAIHISECYQTWTSLRWPTVSVNSAICQPRPPESFSDCVHLQFSGWEAQ